ncbi:Flagellar hook-length control protein FliK [Devosia equisanguinis]|uniref:Flagellar hook-length control protein FliK n=1 Tax=Devosia equisanguinis TaxID=2490941 RepID=A0A447IGZ3_9HYPH|nr:flagellar hook-length control protein FliK [Devosia equisanguinis]VDS06764.1 Flagellar hook-length control protein FliK [Devosia equisanguinis]
MSISTQLPPIPANQASSLVRALEHAPGQVIEARVVGQLGNGTTQVQIGQQTLALALPTLQAPGTVLTLGVQQANGQTQLTLMAVKAPEIPQVFAQSAQSPVPATTVQLSAAALGQTNGPPVAGTVSGAAITGSAGVSGGGLAGVQTGMAAGAGPVLAPQGNANMPAPAVPYASAPASMAAGAGPLPGPVTGANAAGALGQQMASAGAGLAGAAGATTGSTAAVPQATSPQAAVLQMVHQAVPRQNSVVGLTTMLAAVAGAMALPEPVAKAVQQVLAQRLSLDGQQFNGQALKSAVNNSGIFQEAKLGAGRAGAAGGDLKTALLGLRQSLGQWLGAQAPLEQVASLPPPLRGLVPRARAGDAMPGEIPEEPEQLGRILQERTEAALSRVRLHQAASLPDPADRPGVQWSMDLPVMVAGQQVLLHLHIHGDPQDGAERAEDRGWQLRFAINLPEAGEVGAQVTLRHKISGVLLWADDAETAQSLARHIDNLKQALESVGLVAGSVIVKTGAPVAPQPPQSGHFVDAVR